ncbi:hypothetical protein B484DRAFT_447776 [Ochromonadaceae sp. CCMP2298]|nr:hypothetical protein B484DRAFT_447776 [Ochromonadaceae sp. CCMP2298]
MARQDPWKAAFKRAVEVDLEGAKDFADFVPVPKKRKHTEGEEDGEGEEANNSAGLLGDFVKSLHSGLKAERRERRRLKKLGGGDGIAEAGEKGLTAVTAEIVETVETGDAVEAVQTGRSKLPPSERDMVEVCGRQICRAWLKHHYLSLGQPCPGDCLRKHAITCRPEALYKDYSFKGLSANQKKSIFAKVSAETEA